MEFHLTLDKLYKRRCTDVSNVLHDVVLLLLHVWIMCISGSILFCCDLFVFVTPNILSSNVLWQVADHGSPLALRDLLYIT